MAQVPVMPFAFSPHVSRIEPIPLQAVGWTDDLLDLLANLNVTTVEALCAYAVSSSQELTEALGGRGSRHYREVYQMLRTQADIMMSLGRGRDLH